MTTQTYSWKPKAGIAIDPQVAGEAVEALQKRLDGPVTPAELLAHAKASNSVLRDAFEWDDTEAAIAYRIQQAGHLLRSLVVTVKVSEAAPSKPIRAFVNVVAKPSEQAPEGKRGYVGLSVAMGDASMRAQVVAQAWRELAAWRARYRDYSELAELVTEIERLEAERAA